MYNLKIFYKKIKKVVYFSHILSSVICGMVYNLIFKQKQQSELNINNISKAKQENLFSTCLTEIINSLFLVGGYITIFYLIAEIFDLLNIFNTLAKISFPLLSKFGLSENSIKSILFGILEVTCLSPRLRSVH